MSRWQNEIEGLKVICSEQRDMRWQSVHSYLFLDNKQPIVQISYLSYEHEAKTLPNFGCAHDTCQTGPVWPFNSAEGYVCPDGFSWNKSLFQGIDKIYKEN